MSKINLFKRTYTDEEKSFIEFFENTFLFEGLSKSELVQLLPLFHKRTYRNNEAVFFRNDPSLATYAVQRGQVELSVDIQEKNEVLKTADEGDIFGENSIVEDSTRLYSAVVTSEAADLWVLPQVSIHDFFAKHSAIQIKILSNFSAHYFELLKTVFQNYRKDYGFFELSQLYQDTEDAEEGKL